MLLDVCILNPKEIIFEGKAQRVSLPGERGIFEVLPFHKRILSRLVCGTLLIDAQSIPIKRGIARVELNKVTVIVEQ